MFGAISCVMSKHLTPSAVVERIIGRPEVVGPAIGKTNKVGYLWRRASKGRDAGDIPSARDMRALLAVARDRGLPLMAQDLIYGADEADVAARLAQVNTPAAPVAGVVCGVGPAPAPALDLAGVGCDGSAPALFGSAGDDIPAGGWGGAVGMVAAAPAGAGSGGPAPDAAPALSDIRGAA